MSFITKKALEGDPATIRADYFQTEGTRHLSSLKLLVEGVLSERESKHWRHLPVNTARELAETRTLSAS